MTLVRTTADKLIIRTAPAGADTGKRFIRGQVAEPHATSSDGQWTLIDAPQGLGWASAKYLTPVIPVIPGTPKPRLLYSLAGENPDLTAALEKLRAKASLEGIEFDTADFGGVRTEADTTRILKYRDDDYAVYVRNLKKAQPGKTPIAKTTWRPINQWGTSMHNFGAARDVKITRYPSSFSKSQALERLGALAPSVGLRWGGLFKQPNGKPRPDPPHMQLPITLVEARRRWEARQ